VSRRLLRDGGGGGGRIARAASRVRGEVPPPPLTCRRRRGWRTRGRPAARGRRAARCPAPGTLPASAPEEGGGVVWRGASVVGGARTSGGGESAAVRRALWCNRTAAGTSRRIRGGVRVGSRAERYRARRTMARRCPARNWLLLFRSLARRESARLESQSEKGGTRVTKRRRGARSPPAGVFSGGCVFAQNAAPPFSLSSPRRARDTASPHAARAHARAQGPWRRTATHRGCCTQHHPGSASRACGSAPPRHGSFPSPLGSRPLAPPPRRGRQRRRPAGS